MKDFKIWRSIIKNPVRITTTVARQVTDKAIENYTDEEFELVEEQERALATLTMALSPDILLKVFVNTLKLKLYGKILLRSTREMKI